MEHHGGEYAHHNADEVHAHHDHGGLSREEGAGKEGIDGNLGCAGHEGDEHDGESAVALAGQNAAGHYAGHGASEADEQRHDATARETHLAQQLVHDKGNAGHVAAVLQHAEEEEQGDDHGQEHQYGAHTAEDAVYDERTHHGSDVPRFQGICCGGGQCVNALLAEVLQPGAQSVEGDVEHASHNDEKGGQRGPFSGQHAVNASAAAVFLALARLYNGVLAKTAYVVVTHVGKCGAAVQSALFLHLAYNVCHGLLFVGVESECLAHHGVAFRQFAGGKTQGDVGMGGMVFNKVHDGMQASVYGSSVVFGVAEVLSHGLFLVACNVQGVLYQFVNALALDGGDGDDGDAQHAFHLVDADGSAVALNLVHHV